MMNKSYETTSKLMLDHCLCTIDYTRTSPAPRPKVFDIGLKKKVFCFHYLAPLVGNNAMQFKAGDAMHCVESAVTESVPGDAIHCLESVVTKTVSLPDYGDFAVENVCAGWAVDVVTGTFVG